MKTNTKILYWSPRILCILAILFVSMFSLDAFEPGVPFWNQILAFLMHMIPSFIVTGVLFIISHYARRRAAKGTDLPTF